MSKRNRNTFSGVNAKESVSAPTKLPGTVGAMNFGFAKYTPANSGEYYQGTTEWINYGKDNRYPDYIIKQYLSSPVHGTLCAGIAAMIAGEGIINVPTISDRDVLMMCLDLKLHGGFYIELRPSLDGSKISAIDHLPFERVRLDKEDEAGEIQGVWYSRNFSDLRKKVNKPTYIEKAPDKPFDEWTEEERATPKVAWGFMPTPGALAYPKPDYQPGMNWIEMSQQVSEYHINNLLNGLMPSVIISMVDREADPDKRAQLKRDLDEVKGAENAGRFMMLWADSSEAFPKIEAFPLTGADKQYEFLAGEILQQILFAHRVTSPLLFGIRDTGGGLGSNTDEIVVSAKRFMKQVIEPMQRIILSVFESVGFTEAQFLQNESVGEIAPAPNPTKMSKEPDMIPTDESLWISHLERVGERVSLDEWEVVEESFCDTLDEPENFRAKFSAEQKSKWGDSGLYKLRYRYSTNITADSRAFCKRMVDLSVAGIVYRKEDIDVMSDNGVNGQFAPEGETSYDIFQWKGGVYCHHKWVRVIFMRKRDINGKILPPSKTDEMENDKRVANNPYVPRKGDEGVAPINTASRGSLKYG